MIDYLVKLLSRFQLQGERFTFLPFFGYQGSIVDLESGEKIATIRVGLSKGKPVEFEWNKAGAFREIYKELLKRQLRVSKINILPLCVYIDVVNLETEEVEATIFINMKKKLWEPGFVVTEFSPSF